MKNRIKNILLAMMIVGLQTGCMFASHELFTAIDNGDTAAVKSLIATGSVDVNAKINDFCPLMLALTSGNNEILGVLLDAGANPNETGHEGWGSQDEPLLFIPVISHNAQAVKKLVEAGANVNALDENHQTVLHQLLSLQRMGLDDETSQISKKIEQYLVSKGAIK